MFKPRPNVDAVGVHHYYLGIFSVVVGLTEAIVGFALLMFAQVPVWVPNVIVSIGIGTILIGLIEMVDDYIQHERQIEDPDYRSPLNRLYTRTIWRIGFVKKFNIWFDNFFDWNGGEE